MTSTHALFSPQLYLPGSIRRAYLSFVCAFDFTQDPAGDTIDHLQQSQHSAKSVSPGAHAVSKNANTAAVP